MKRILFVDDEPHVLQGLENLLRRQRRKWNIVFALGGEQALAELARAPFDVVVSDMRMPGMDGAVLLQRVKELHPAVARIVLSGHADREQVMRALPVSHQYVSKPCDAELLRQVLERACELRARLDDEKMRGVVGKLDRLPSVPETYWELSRAFVDPGVDTEDIARIVERDPAMGMKVLQLVNSAYFGPPRRVASIAQAVTYLGVELLKGLALTAVVFAAMERAAPVAGFSMEDLQRYSILVARGAKSLVTDPAQADDAFTAGLVHDVGQIVLALTVPGPFAEALRVSAETRRPLHVVENELLGVDHAGVGAYLLGAWGLPLSMVDAVARHHAPRAGDDEVVRAVHAADAFVDGQAQA